MSKISRRGFLAGTAAAGAAPADGSMVILNWRVEVPSTTVQRVETGEFGAHMQVSLVNDGPVTFWLES